MTTITDFTNELHIRLYVADLLRDNIKDDNFVEQADKMFAFIVKNASLPPQPKVHETSADILSNWNKILAGITGLDKEEKMSEIEKKFHLFKAKSVRDPKSDKAGIIVGFSKEFNSLIVSCDPGQKGMEPCETDSIAIDKGLIMDGVFYISIEEVERQLGS